MKFDMSATFNSLNGQPVKDGAADAKLGVIAARALATPLERDKALAPESVVKRWNFALRLQKCEEVELTPEELTEVRARIAEVFALEVSGPALVLLGG